MVIFYISYYLFYIMMNMKSIVVGGAGSRLFFGDDTSGIRSLSSKISGVEVFFREPDMVMSFLELKRSVDIFSRFKEMSIHAPFADVCYGDDDKTFSLLSNLRKAYKILGAKRIVFHPASFSDLSVLDNCGMNVLVENMDIRKDKFIRWEEFADIFKKHDFGLCLDVAHASSFSYKVLDDFVSHLSNKIEQFHVSHIVDGKHTPMYKIGAEGLKHFGFLSDFGKPLVIENMDSSADLIEKEVDFLQGF